MGVRTNTIVTLGASAVFGILAIVIARGWVDDAVTSQYQQSRADTVVAPAPRIKTTQVLVADVDLNFGDPVTQQNVRLIDYPENALPMGSYTDYSELFLDPSLPTVALSKMVANEPVLDFKVSGPGGKGSLSAIIGENMRAVSIRVNEVAGVGGFIVPGDHVDVMLTREQTRGGDAASKVTNLLVQKLKVLGTDQNNNQQSAAPNVVKTVTLEVDNEDAQKLILAMSVGKLSLTLRRAGETDAVQPTQVSIHDLNALASAQKARRTYTGAKRSASSVTPQTAPSTGSTAKVTVTRNGKQKQVKVKKEPEQQPQLVGGSL